MSEQERSRDEGDALTREVRRLCRILRGIARAARDAGLTGQMAGGRGQALKQYHAVLRRLRELEAVPENLFSPLPDDASFDEIGVAAAGLAAYLQDEDDEPHRRFKIGGGIFEATPGHVKVIGFPGHLGELGELLREYAPDFLKHKIGRHVRVDIGGARAAAGAHCGHVPDAPSGEGRASREERLRRIDEELGRVSERLAAASAELRRSEVGPVRQAALAEEIRDLAARQAALLQERAHLSAEI